MPTMQEIEQEERDARESAADGAYIYVHPDYYLKLLGAARRGVEADAEIAQLRRVIERGRDSTRTELLLSEQLSEQRAGNIKLLERAEKAKAELAALKVERDEAVRTEQEEIAQIVDRWAVIHDGAEFDFDALVDEIRARNQGDSNEH